MKLKTVCLELRTNSFAKNRDNNLEQRGYKSTPFENLTLETVCCRERKRENVFNYIGINIYR